MDFEGAALWIFLFLALAWLVVLITTISNLVNRRDLSLPVKILWGIVICMAPVVGLIVYIIVYRRRRTLTRRQVQK